MDLSMILNNANDGYESSAYPSPRSPVAVSTRVSVDDMHSAVAILSDFQREGEENARDHHDHHNQHVPPPTQAATGTGFSGLDLLFQADAMIQKRVSPERRAPSSSSTPSSKKKNKTTNNKMNQNRASAVMEKDDENELVAPADAIAASPQYLRSGMWTREEEEYAAALIFYFLRGALPIAEGTTLRKYLAEQLCCNRRRVSMKLATETIADKKIPRKVGASVFVALKPTPSDEGRRQVVDALEHLRKECFRDVEDPLATKTPRQEPFSARGGGGRLSLSPLMLESNDDATEVAAAFATPSRRKVARHSPSPKKPTRRGSLSSNPKTSPPQIKRRHPMIIRTGFDSEEEELFVSAMVEYFLDGTLDLQDGTRLVTYLCGQLDCSAKTLSMKLAPRKMGEHKFPENVGSCTFSRKDDGAGDASSEIFEAEAHVFELRQNWLQTHEPVEELVKAEAQVKDEEPEDPEDKEDEEQEQEPRENQHAQENNNNQQQEMCSPVSTPSRKYKLEHYHPNQDQGQTQSQSHPPSTPVVAGKSPTTTPRSYSRSGPWSRHEEEYAAGLIDSFFRGVLDIVEGTTLRAFLTSRLNCNPMRISKKLASHTIADVKIPKKLGSATYVRRDGVSREERRAAEDQLHHLETVSKSEQNQKEEIVMGVIGHKHSREEADRLAQLEYETRMHVAHSSSVHGSTPTSPFKMRRIHVDEYPQHPQHPHPPQYHPHPLHPQQHPLHPLHPQHYPQQHPQQYPQHHHHHHDHAAAGPLYPPQQQQPPQPPQQGQSPYNYYDTSMRYQRIAY